MSDSSPKPAVVSLGTRMPTSPGRVPVLAPSGEGEAHSEIGEGLTFTGNAVLAGVCTVKGLVQGNLQRAEGARVSVVVTETGVVKGDIVADQISVLGRTDGLLDATGGTVSLHETADVSGHVKYQRIQVNGAELNATLERSPKPAAS